MATSYYNQMPLATSPAINAGHSELSATIDFTGALREGIADIGAFENTVVSIPADQNHAQSLALNIFPNPVTEYVTVNAVWNQPEEVTIDLYTVYGKKVDSYHSQGKAQQIQHVFSFHDKQQGIFVLVFKVGDISFVRKIIMQ